MNINESPDGATNGLTVAVGAGDTIPLGPNTSEYQIHTNPTIGSNSAPFTIAENNKIKINGTIDLSPETDTSFDITIEAVNASGEAGQAKTFTVTVANNISDDFDMSNPFTFTVAP